MDDIFTNVITDTSDTKSGVTFVSKLVNKYTGLVCPYHTPANYKSAPGHVSSEPDPTVQSDYEPVSQIVARVKRGDLSALREFDGGYEYDDVNDGMISEEDADDYIDPEADVLDKQIDLEDYIRQKTAEAQQAQASVSAGSTTQADDGRTDEARNDAKEVSPELTE